METAECVICLRNKLGNWMKHYSFTYNFNVQVLVFFNAVHEFMIYDAFYDFLPHVDDPGSEKYPSLHAVHSLLPEVEYVFAGQDSQNVPSLLVPAGHSEQVNCPFCMAGALPRSHIHMSSLEVDVMPSQLGTHKLLFSLNLAT